MFSMGKPCSKRVSTLKIKYYKHGLPMRAPSVRDFSVFAHLGNLGPLQ